MRGLIAIVLLLPGCWLVFEDHGSGGGDDICLAGEGGGPPGGALAPAPLRDPDNLTCQSFGGGCDPRCGPCPAADQAPVPTWGACGSVCETLGEAACAANPTCRVAKDARCAISKLCATDFLGCFPTDTAADPSADCFVHDGWACSRNSNCTAFHRTDPCPVDGGPGFECPRTFAMCMPEGRLPGRCFDPVVCDRVQPACPPSSVAGVANGCYTDACIPVDLCEPTPGR